jgi:hypothetical protein
VQLLTRIRRLLLAVLVLGMAGTLIELLLISHYEDGLQLLPVGLIGAALALVAWHVLRPSGASLRTLQAAMLLFLVTGLTGIGLHFNGAAEFQREIDPSQSFWQIAARVVRVHAPPLLAPGVMVQFGLLGLIYSYRHPYTAPAGTANTESEHVT